MSLFAILLDKLESWKSEEKLKLKNIGHPELDWLVGCV